MTRINLVDPIELTDQHLVAEYREIFMVGPALQRTLKSKSGLTEDKIPKKFTLNKGHVSYFYDKGLYLHNRYRQLREEMKRRGMNPDPDRKFKAFHFPPSLYHDWTPSEEDKELVRERIRYRISQRPGFYRYMGEEYEH